MSDVIDIEKMYTSCEYQCSAEELAQLEEIYREYDEMIENELEENHIEIGFCGFPCNFGCPTCLKYGYDHSDEF